MTASQLATFLNMLFQLDQILTYVSFGDILV